LLIIKCDKKFGSLKHLPYISVIKLKIMKKLICSLPKGVKLVITINLIIYIITVIIFNLTEYSLKDFLGTYPTYSEHFNTVQVLTSMFVHQNYPSHFIFNMITILIFAPFVERIIGFNKFILTYIFCGLCGFLLVNFSYYKNKSTIEKEITKLGLKVSDIKMDGDRVSHDYILSLNDNKQKNVIRNYEYVTSKTYGSSTAAFGFIILYLLLTPLTFKKIFYIVLGVYFILDNINSVFNNQSILNGSTYTHLGGVVGGIIIYCHIKLKKVIN